MNDFFLLNFLSFNSINLVRLFTNLGICGVHAPYSKLHSDVSSNVGGYTVSNIYTLLNEYYKQDCVFILFKEDPNTIIDHLLYGFNQRIYNPVIVQDFKTYWGVEEINGVIPNIESLIQKYYADVEKYFSGAPNFVVVDLTQFGPNFNSFVLSDTFLQLALNGNLTISEKKITEIRTGVHNNPAFTYNDFLAPGGSLPIIYPVNTYIGGLPYFFDFNIVNNSYQYTLIDEYQRNVKYADFSDEYTAVYDFTVTTSPSA